MNFVKTVKCAIYAAPTWMHDHLYSPVGMTTPTTVSVDDIRRFLGEVGIHKGATLFVHSSWLRLSNGTFSAKDLILMLLDVVGAEGTLAMPAFPTFSTGSDGTQVFDVRKSPSAAGLLTEAFRRFPGVVRSININHSVCAFGKNAEWLVSDHHKSITAWDDCSPYYRLGCIQDAYIVGLGVGWRLKIATSLHCADSMLREELTFFKKLFPKIQRYNYIDAQGNTGEHEMLMRSGLIYTPKLAKHFSKQELIEECVGGLDVYAIKAKLLIDRVIELGRKGKTMYVYPIPWTWLFKRN